MSTPEYAALFDYKKKIDEKLVISLTYMYNSFKVARTILTKY